MSGGRAGRVEDTTEDSGERPDQVTVLGVDGHDPRLHTELHRYVPDRADALYLLAIPPSRIRPDELLLAAIYNPPATVAALILRAWRHLVGPSLQSAEAVETVADDRTIPLRTLSIGGFAGIPEQRLPWTVGAWLTTCLALMATVALLAVPGPTSVMFALVVGPLACSYVLAHAGAHVRVRDAAIFATIRRQSADNGDTNPVVVVPERHAPGVAAAAKDDRIRTIAHTVSTDLTADESLY